MEKITQKANEIEQFAIDFIAIFAPWLTPIPSAYLVGRATMTYLEWHWIVALVAAVAVESVGVVSVVNSLRLWDYNATRAKTLDQRAPFEFAAALVAIYLIVTIGLTVLLDVLPHLARIAPAIFPLLALVGAANIAVKDGQKRREGKREQRKSGNKPPVVQHQPETPVATGATSGVASATALATNPQRLLQHYRPGIGPTELGTLAGVHKSTASRWLKQRSNGHPIED